MNGVVRYTAVPGTWAYSQKADPSAWYRAGSPLASYLDGHQVRALKPEEPFLWSTDVNGADFWRRWFRWFGVNPSGDHNDWDSGGWALRWYLRGTRKRHRAVLAHSHGGQVVAYACSHGLTIPVLITIATPVRCDMSAVWKKARPNIGYWLHIYSTDGDRMQVYGSFGDGAIGIERAMPLANMNHGLPKMKHSRLVSDPEAFSLWQSQGWIDLIRQCVREAA